MRFRSHHKVQRAAPFANPAKNLAVPRKSTFTSLGATSFAFLCPSTAGQKEGKIYEPESAFNHWIYRP
jgi:hypothetical protein